MDRRVIEAVERGDLDELIRVVEALCGDRDWPALLELRDRSARAIERGRQLWPAARHAEYRLALEAPAEFAGAVLVEGAGGFTLGPISEVAASTHTWAELAPHAPAGPVAALAAHERVVRGDDLSRERIEPAVLDCPLVLQEWEPTYMVATYRAHAADFPAPEQPRLKSVTLPRAPETVDDLLALDALRVLAHAWTTGSDGRAEAVATRGDPLGAIAALGVRRARVAEVDGSAALAHMAWTAASGGAHGRRRGAATGRFDAWLAAAAVAGLGRQWPVRPDDLGVAIDRLDWLLWDAGEPRTGWSLRLAVADRSTGRAWALAATDAR